MSPITVPRNVSGVVTSTANIGSSRTGLPSRARVRRQADRGPSSSGRSPARISCADSAASRAPRRRGRSPRELARAPAAHPLRLVPARASQHLGSAIAYQLFLESRHLGGVIRPLLRQPLEHFVHACHRVANPLQLTHRFVTVLDSRSHYP